jgi:hypothetical protein
MKQHYALWYRLDQQDRYLIWISDQIDTVYVHQKKIATFESLDALKAFAATKHIKMMPEEPVLNNFDTVQEWLNETNGAINCIDSMNTWNVKGITPRIKRRNWCIVKFAKTIPYPSMCKAQRVVCGI